jgi:hypothetical protein
VNEFLAKIEMQATRWFASGLSNSPAKSEILNTQSVGQFYFLSS